MTVAMNINADSRAKRFKEATTAVHERLDKTVMAAAPFASRENYSRFLRFQHRLHRRVEPLYAEPSFQPLLPDLAARSRYADVERDLADLGAVAPEGAETAPALPLPEALGWLYVVEGSNMGAAFLLKAAQDLGLSSDFGARHLAGHAEGRGLHWRRFTAGLDAVSLTPEEEVRAQNAAADAFSYALDLITQEMPAR